MQEAAPGQSFFTAESRMNTMRPPLYPFSLSGDL
jgi:hypothetical protein